MKKIIILFVLVPLSNFMMAQESSDFTVSLNHFALSVADVDASAKFYKNSLNLEEIINRTEKPGIRWFSLGDGKELHLISHIKSEIVINKAVHLALTTNNFDAFINKIKAMNIQYSDWPGKENTITTRADGIKQIYIQDPDGYWIEVNSVAED